MKKGVVPVVDATMLGLRFFLLRSALGLVHRDGMQQLSHDYLLWREVGTMAVGVSFQVED